MLVKALQPGIGNPNVHLPMPKLLCNYSWNLVSKASDHSFRALEASSGHCTASTICEVLHYYQNAITTHASLTIGKVGWVGRVAIIGGVVSENFTDFQDHGLPFFVIYASRFQHCDELVPVISVLGVNAMESIKHVLNCMDT